MSKGTQRNDPTGFTVIATLQSGAEFTLRATIAPNADGGEMARLITGITQGLRGAGFPTVTRVTTQTEEVWDA